MNNPSGKKLEKLVFGMFDQMVEGSDKYVTKQGSTWLIFTEDKRWVVEFTKDKTLWFNYNLFQSELDLVSKNCTQERDLIKNWFESRFLGIDVVEESLSTAGKPLKVEDTIENGVRHTEEGIFAMQSKIEDTIQNGVKKTYSTPTTRLIIVEDTIQNGVRHTVSSKLNEFEFVEDTIQNGVRHTNLSVKVKANQVEDTIQNGVRHTEVDGMRIRRGVKDAIQEGVKETRFHKSSNLYRIEDTRTLWGKSGDEGVVEYIIQEGVKNTTTTRWARKDAVENTIQNGVKHTEDGDWLDQDERIDDIIENGVKETREVTFLNQMFIEETIQNGVKDGI
jgi:predicted transcriptional regulator